jgi:peroxiredoxin Q/BCP
MTLPGARFREKSFTATREDFDAANIKVVGVNQDDVSSHKDFCSKFGFKIDLLSDTDARLLNDAGAGRASTRARCTGIEPAL